MTSSDRAPWDLPLPDAIEIVPDGALRNIDLDRAINIFDSCAGAGRTSAGKPLFPDRIPADRIDHFAGVFASARVHDPTVRAGKETPLAGEVDYEKRRISSAEHSSWGVLYDGHLYLDIVEPLAGDIHPRHAAFIVTGQLIGTFEPVEKRYHARVALYGFPSIISVPGIVVAPARSRSYHIARKMGMQAEDNDPHLEHGEGRLTEVLAGLFLQALFFQMTGDPFCADEDCRLFNAHTQAQLIKAQLSSGASLCKRHKDFLESKKRGGKGLRI